MNRLTKGDLIICMIIAVFMLFSFKSCMDANHRSDSMLNALRDSSTAITRYKNIYNQEVASHQVIELQDKEQILALTIKNKEMQDLLTRFKSVTVAATVSTVFSRGKISIPLKNIPDTNSMVFDSIRGKLIHIPSYSIKKYDVPFEYSDDYLTIEGSVCDREVIIDSLAVRNKMDIVAGEKKMGFWHRNEFRIDITNSNPYMTVTGITTYAFKPSVAWYNNKFLWMAAGVIGSIIIFK